MNDEIKEKKYFKIRTDVVPTENISQHGLTPDHQLEYKEYPHTDENLITLQKIHAILVNCVNLSKKQKLEFTESERFFMKLYLKKFQDKKCK